MFKHCNHVFISDRRGRTRCIRGGLARSCLGWQIYYVIDSEQNPANLSPHAEKEKRDLFNRHPDITPDAMLPHFKLRLDLCNAGAGVYEARKKAENIRDEMDKLGPRAFWRQELMRSYEIAHSEYREHVLKMWDVLQAWNKYHEHMRMERCPMYCVYEQINNLGVYQPCPESNPGFPMISSEHEFVFNPAPLPAFPTEPAPSYIHNGAFLEDGGVPRENWANPIEDCHPSKYDPDYKYSTWHRNHDLGELSQPYTLRHPIESRNRSPHQPPATDDDDGFANAPRDLTLGESSPNPPSSNPSDRFSKFIEDYVPTEEEQAHGAGFRRIISSAYRRIATRLAELTDETAEFRHWLEDHRAELMPEAGPSGYFQGGQMADISEDNGGPSQIGGHQANQVFNDNGVPSKIEGREMTDPANRS